MMETETKNKRKETCCTVIFTLPYIMTTVVTYACNACQTYPVTCHASSWLVSHDMPYNKQGIIVLSGCCAHIFVFMLPDCCFGYWLGTSRVAHCARSPFVPFL